MSNKPKPKLSPTPPRQFGPVETPHWFKCVFVHRYASARLPETVEYTARHLEAWLDREESETISISGMGPWQELNIRILALNARDAHYQLSIQMSALGWTEGQNWRVAMICPEETK